MTSLQRSWTDRVLSVPRPRPGELALNEELGPKGKRFVGAFSALSLVAVAYAGWWIYRRLGQPTRLYPRGQYEPALWAPFKERTTWSFLWQGAANTLRAAGVGILLALIIGVLMAAVRHGGKRQPWQAAVAYLSVSVAVIAAVGKMFSERTAALATLGCLLLGLVLLGRQTATLYTEFFRACALVVLIGSPFNLFGVTPFWSVVTGLTLYYSTTIAEVVRSALRSLPKGQTEAGLAVGLTGRQSMTNILLPQAIQRALPNVLAQTASLLKDTSLGFAVTFRDLLAQSQTAGKQFDNYFPMLLVCAALYIALIGTINYIANRLQRRSR
jgi:glutamate transport system permease protein